MTKPFNAKLWQARHFWTHDSVQVRVRLRNSFREFQRSTTPVYDFQWRNRRGCWEDYRAAAFLAKYCPYRVGDFAPVREPWLSMREWDHGGAGVAYAADHVSDSVDKWKPASKMPIEYVRQWLRITSVSCGPVREITEADAVLCGFPWDDQSGKGGAGKRGKRPTDKFRDQWQADHPRGNFETDCCWTFNATVERGK